MKTIWIAFICMVCTALGGDYKAIVLKAVDGDTLQVRIELGLEVSVTKHLRIDGINAPEKNTEEGKAAAAFLRSLIEGKQVAIKTNSKQEFEKYGRVLASVILDGSDVGALMIQKGLAKEYHGGAR